MDQRNYFECTLNPKNAPCFAYMLNSDHTSQKCNIHVTCYDKMCSFVDKHWIVSSGKVLTGLWVVLSAHQWMPDCLATRSPYGPVLCLR